MHLKLDQVRTFITVAETGSLNDAARMLDRTPSAVSMTLKQFTEQMGDPLFETDRKSTLTSLGLFVLKQSRNALQEFEESMERLHLFSKGNIGTVRVASVPSFSTRLLPEIVRQYRAEQPEVRLDLRDIDSDLIDGAVRNGIVDFGIASKLNNAPNLESELLLEEPFGVICRPEHALVQQAKPIRWKQLSRVQFISNELCKLINNKHIERLCNKSDLHIRNVATILSFIDKDFGVSLLPRTAVNKHYNLKFLPLEDKTAVRQIFFLQHQHHQMLPAASTFKQYIKQNIDSKF